MAPTNPWGKKNTATTGFPGLKSAQSNNATPPKSQYDEIQENELIALSSIYGDDFKRIETKQGAWKVCKIVLVHCVLQPVVDLPDTDSLDLKLTDCATEIRTLLRNPY